MANTKKPAKKPTRKAASKATPKAKAKKVSPDFYKLRDEWMATKDEVAYCQRKLSRANASQSSIADRREQMAVANADLLKARDAMKAAEHAFLKSKGRRR